MNKQTIVPGRYQVVPRTLCFITHGEDVLLLRGAPDKRIWPNQYNGIGGHVEADEDIYTAARREISEETGLQVSQLILRGTINIPVKQSEQENTGIMVFVFSAQANSREAKPSEEGTLVWVGRDEIATLDLVEDLPVLIPLVLDHPPNAPLFHARYTYNDQGQLVIALAKPA